MRNDVPGGAEAFLVPPAGVGKAGGARGRVLIEHLRAKIRALEQVPVSLAIPPAPGAAPPPPRPACSFFPPQDRPIPLPPCGGAREYVVRAEGGEFQTQSPLLTPLPTLPHKGGGGITSPDTRPLLNQLKRGGLHEIRAEAYRDYPAALALALAVIAEQAAKPVAERELVLWCFTKNAAREWGRPYGPGLLSSGLDPARLLIVEARNTDTAAWALEEGLKSRALIAALAAIEIGSPLAARRLGLAAQGSRTPCLLLSSHRQASLPGTLTRWRVAAERSARALFDAGAPGAPSWQLTLERCRGEVPGQSFIVEFSDESFRLHLFSASSDRAMAAGEDGKRRRASR